MWAGISAGIFSLSVCEDGPATSLQNCAPCRARQSTEHDSLAWGIGLFSPSCIPPEQSLCPLLTGVPMSCIPYPCYTRKKPCRVQCETLLLARGEQRVSCMSTRQVFCSGSALLYPSPCAWIIRPFSSVPAGLWWKQDRLKGKQ